MDRLDVCIRHARRYGRHMTSGRRLPTDRRAGLARGVINRRETATNRVRTTSVRFLYKQRVREQHAYVVRHTASEIVIGVSDLCRARAGACTADTGITLQKRRSDDVSG